MIYYEMGWCEYRNKEQLAKMLAEGWEPFSVSLRQCEDDELEIVWIRRPVKEVVR